MVSGRFSSILIRRLLCTKPKVGAPKTAQEPSKSNKTTSPVDKEKKPDEKKASGDKVSEKKEENSNKLQPHCESPDPKFYGFQLKPPKKVKVALFGADTGAGQIAGFLLKQHPIIGKVYLFGTRLVEDIALDLNTIDTSCKVEAYHGECNVEHALRAADIAVLIDTDSKDYKIERKFTNSYCRVQSFAQACSLHCPRAVQVICVDPVCCMLPLTQKVIEDTPWFHPSKLVGSVATLQSRINTIAAEYLSLDPVSIHVPLTGGPDSDTIVPIISLISPDPGISLRDQRKLFKVIKTKLKSSDEKLFKLSKEMKNIPQINEGYAIVQMLNAIAKGLIGYKHAYLSVMARTNVLPPLKYLVSTVRFGQGGIVDNYGIPKLSKFEIEQLNLSIQKIEKHQQNVKKILRRIERPRTINQCEACA